MPDKLTKAQFATKLQNGEFDAEPWYQSYLDIAKQAISPIPQIKDKADVLATNLDTFRPEVSSRTFGVEDIPEGIGAIPDIIKNLGGMGAPDLQTYLEMVKATLKGMLGGTLEGVAQEITPAALAGSVVGKVGSLAKTGAKGVAKVATEIPELDARITGLLTKAGTKASPLSKVMEHPSPARNLELANPNRVKPARLPQLTDEQIEEMLRRLGGRGDR